MPGYLSISGNIDISLVPSCSLYIHTKAGIQMKPFSLHSDLVRAKTLVSSPGLRRTTENEVGKIFITHFLIFFFTKKYMISSISCIDLVYANILEIFLKIVAVFGNCTSHYPISGNQMTLFFL